MSPEHTLTALQSAVILGYLASRKIRHIRGLPEATTMLCGATLATTLEYLYSQYSQENLHLQENWACLIGMISVAFLTYRLLFGTSTVGETSTSAVLPSTTTPSILPNLLCSSPDEELNAAIKIIEQIPLNSTSIKRITLPLGDAFISDTPYEGGATPEAYADWIHFLLSLETTTWPVPLPLDISLTKELANELLSSVNIFSLFEKQKVPELINAIRTRLDQTGYCVIPLRYGSTGSSPVHAFGCVLSKDSAGQIKGYFLNRGEGSKEHCVVAFENGKVKRDFQSDSFTLNKRALEVSAPEAILFFEALMLFGQPNKSVKPYHTEEIYRLFLWEEGTADEPKGAKERGVTTQRGGSCSEQLVRHHIRIFLQHHRHQLTDERTTYKLLVMRQKFTALLKAWREHSINSELMPVQLLTELVREFALSFEKKDILGILSRKEMVIYYALCQIVEKSIQSYRPPAQHLKTDLAQPLLSSPHVCPVITAKAYNTSVNLSDYKSPLPAHSPNPKNLLSWLRSISAYSRDGGASIVPPYIHSLPLPGSAEGDLFWTEVPEKEISLCVKELLIVMDIYHTYQWEGIKDIKTRYIETLLLNMSILTYVDFLLRRKNELHLDNFRAKIECIDPGNVLFNLILIPQGMEQRRWIAIKNYWTSSSMQNRRYTFIRPNFSSRSRQEIFSQMNTDDTGIAAKVNYFYQFIQDETALFHSLAVLDKQLIIAGNAEFERKRGTSLVNHLTINLGLNGWKVDDILVHPYEFLKNQFYKTYVPIGKVSDYSFLKHYPKNIPEDYFFYEFITMQCTALLEGIFGYEGLLTFQQPVAYDLMPGNNALVNITGDQDNRMIQIILKNILRYSFFENADCPSDALQDAFQTEDRFYSRPLLSLSENQVLDSEFGAKTSHYIKLSHEVCKVMHKPALQITALLNWLTSNTPSCLEERFCRIFIRGCLFKNDALLQKALVENPHILTYIRAYTNHVLGEPNLSSKALTFWFEMAYLIETHAAEVLKESFDKSHIRALIETIDELAKKGRIPPDEANTLRCYLAGFRSSTPLRLEEMRCLATSYFRKLFAPCSSLPYWVDIDILHQWNFHVHAIKKAVASEPSLLSDCVREITGIEEAEAKKIRWVNAATSNGKYEAKVRGDRYTLDLISGKLYRNGNRLFQGKLTNEISAHFDVQTVLGRSAHQLPFISHIEGDITWFETTDGTVRIKTKNNEFCCIEKRFTFESEPAFYTFRKDAWEKLFGFKPPQKCIGWECLPDYPGRKHIILTDYQGIPYAKVFQHYYLRWKNHVVKIDAQGKEYALTQYLKLLSTPLPIPGLNTLHNPKKTFVWVTPTADSSPTIRDKQISNFIKRVDFPTLGLTFTVNQDKQAVCDQFPAYHLASDQACEQLERLRGIVMLEHREDPLQQAVLIPAGSFVKSDRFGSVENLAAGSADGLIDSIEENGETAPYYLYKIDPRTNKLIYDSPDTFLLLIEVYMQLQKYDAALSLLDEAQFQVSPSKRRVYGLVSKGKTPFDIIISLRLILLFRKEPLDSIMREEIEKRLDTYYQVQSSIPARFHLTPQEEGILHLLVGMGHAMQPYQLEHLALHQHYLFGNRMNTQWVLKHTLHDKLFTLEDLGSLENYLGSLDLVPPSNHPQSDYAHRSKGDEYIVHRFFQLLETAVHQKQPVSRFDYELFRLFAFGHRNPDCFDTKAQALLNFLYAVRHFPNRTLLLRTYQQAKRDIPLEWQKTVDGQVNVTGKNRLEFLNRIQAILPSRKVGPRYGSCFDLLSVAGVGPTAVNPPLLSPDAIPSFNAMVQQATNLETHLPHLAPASFETLPLPVSREPFVLNEVVVADPLANHLLERIKGGYVPARGHTYRLKPNQSLPQLIESLDEQRKKFKSTAERLKQDCLACANGPSDEELKDLSDEERLRIIKRRNAISSGKQEALTMNRLYIDYLFGDLTSVVENNPYLASPAICQKLIQLLMEYFLAQTVLDHATEALKEARKAHLMPNGSLEKELSIAEVGAIIHRKRSYNPYDQPLLLAYEYATGLLLRPEQATLLTRIFELVFSPRALESRDLNHLFGELNRLFFEFRAGGGKTKILATLLAVKAIQLGMCPVFISLPDTHDITKEDFRASIAEVLHAHVDSIDIKLNTHPSESQLDQLYSQLERGHKKRKCFIMTPESYHALNLERQLAFKNNLYGKIKRLQNILGFFETKCIFFIDEAHINAHSLVQSNAAVGTPTSLPEDERELFNICMRILSGIPPFDQLTVRDGRLLKEVVRLRENQQALLSRDEDKRLVMHALQKALLTWIGLPEETIQDLEPFMTNKTIAAPQFLTEWNSGIDPELKKKAKQISLARGLLLEILPYTLSLSCYMDYGPSVDPKFLADDPKRKTKDTTAHFEHPDVASAISAQGRYQRGIASIDEMKTFVGGLKKEYEMYLKAGISREHIAVYQQFLSWQEGNAADKITLDTDMKSEAILQKIIDRIGKHPEVINDYLRLHVLPSVTLYPQKITSTAADLAYGCRAAIFFSATLGLKELYPYLKEEEKFLSDDQFLAAVIQKASAPQNSTQYKLQAADPLAFYNEIHEQDPAAFENLEGIIDVGGWSKESSCEEWARAFLAFLKQHPSNAWNFAGVVYFKEVGGVKQRFFLEDEKQAPRLLNTHNIAQGLASLGHKGRKAFTLYGPQDTTGTDLILPIKTKFLVTLGENVELSNLAQGIMRLRRFLLPDSQQTIAWALPAILEAEILQGTKAPNLSVGTFFHWTLLNEAETLKKAIVMRAIQEIQGTYRAYALRKVGNTKTLRPNDPVEQTTSFRQYQKWFFIPMERDSFERYADASGEEETRQALNAVADSFRRSVDILPMNEQEEIERQVQDIIEQTARLIKTIDGKQNNLAAQQHQEQSVVLQQEQNIQAIQHTQTIARVSLSGTHPLKPDDYALEHLTLPRLLEHQPALIPNHFGHDIQPANALYDNTTIFSPDLYVLKNCWKTFTDINILKPIDHLLVVQQDNKKIAYGLSYHDAEIYKRQLLGLPLQGSKVALFTSAGILVANGQGEAAFEGCPTPLRDDPWFKTIQNSLSLYNGKITDYDYARELVQKHPQELKALWNKLVKRMIDVDEQTHVLLMHLLEKIHGITE